MEEQFLEKFDELLTEVKALRTETRKSTADTAMMRLENRQVIDRLKALETDTSDMKKDMRHMQKDMQYMQKDMRHMGVLQEEMGGEIKGLSEAVTDINQRIDNLPTREEFNDLRGDVTIIKTVITDTNKDARLLERRVTKLEKTA